MFVIRNPYSPPRVSAPVARPAVSVTVATQDTLWRGVQPSLRGYYLERIQELNGFNLSNRSAAMGM